MKSLYFLLSLLILVVVSTASVSQAEAATRVHGYTKRSTGTHVMSHYRTRANHSKFDNFSTKGNYNPYTGKKGTVDPFRVKYY